MAPLLARFPVHLESDSVVLARFSDFVSHPRGARRDGRLFQFAVRKWMSGLLAMLSPDRNPRGCA